MKIITTSAGHQIKVDDEDFELLEMITWHVSGGYARTHFGKAALGVKAFMHKLILKLHTSKLMVDHIDRDKLNNQKSNLRIVSRSQNGSNRNKKKNAASKYLGLSKRADGRWLAAICKNGKRTHIGLFESEDAAAIAYNQKALELHGEFANLNKV